MATTHSRPFGIKDRHLRPQRATTRIVLLALVVLVPIIAALTGILGGGAAKRVMTQNEQATLSVEIQPVLRSGNWFESQVVAVPRQPVSDLTVAIDEELWRRMSIDTQAPDAEKAEFKDGSFRYSFGPVEAGSRFLLKLDGQIQSWGFRRLSGKVTLLDGDQPLAGVPLTITVLP